jgi:AbrB family looped-hinge helix DNA binding protein
MSAMKTTIDSAGRVVIPKKLREQAGLQPGMEIEVRCRDGRIEVEPAAPDYHMERRGRFLVAVTDSPTATLSREMVEKSRQDVRRERAEAALGHARMDE